MNEHHDTILAALATLRWMLPVFSRSMIPSSEAEKKLSEIDAAIEWVKGMGWQSMDSAPRDGTEIIVLTREFGGKVFNSHYLEDTGKWRYDMPSAYGSMPDSWLAGWMPLPLPQLPE